MPPGRFPGRGHRDGSRRAPYILCDKVHGEWLAGSDSGARTDLQSVPVGDRRADQRSADRPITSGGRPDAARRWPSESMQRGCWRLIERVESDGGDVRGAGASGLCDRGRFSCRVATSPRPWGAQNRTCRAFSDASSGGFWTVCSRTAGRVQRLFASVGAALERTIRLTLGGCA